jgi:2-polyprenyl-3-methyl-5-hydroxy-6-metoxy-1,4-benzoquinol methylase
VVKTYSSVPGDERQEDVACPCCGGTRSRPALSCGSLRWVSCRACGVVYQNPRPVFDDLRVRYDERYFTYELANEKAFHALMLMGLRDARFQELADPLPRPRRFLDVGCATGMMLETMKGEGWETVGVDVCRPSADYGRRVRGVDIFPGTLAEAALPTGSVSVAHCSHLIEHLPDPRGFLAEVRRVLAPGGYAVLTTPNIDGFQARLFGSGWRSAIADHLVLFSTRTLTGLLERSGFVVRRAVTWGGLAKGTAPGFIKGPMDRLVKPLGWGDVVLCVAERLPGEPSGG